MPAEFAPRPESGRVVTLGRHVGLADVRPDGRTRLDALARFLQDVSDEDSVAAGLDNGGWVMRRLAVRIARTPVFRTDLTLSTWCGGIGARWAERRTDLQVDGELFVVAAALWVHVDLTTGAPIPLPADFTERFGESAGGRRVSARLQHGRPPETARASAWPLRAVDFDVLGHVNNAAYWAAVEEELTGNPRVAWAEMEFRGGLDAGDVVELRIAEHEGGFAIWFVVGDDVRASALVGFAP